MDADKQVIALTSALSAMLAEVLLLRMQLQRERDRALQLSIELVRRTTRRQRVPRPKMLSMVKH